MTYLLAYFDGIPSPSGKKHAVTSLNTGGDDMALLVGRSRTDGNDGSLW
jgi:hypothetical protein